VGTLMEEGGGAGIFRILTSVVIGQANQEPPVAARALGGPDDARQMGERKKMPTARKGEGVDAPFEKGGGWRIFEDENTEEKKTGTQVGKKPVKRFRHALR